MQHRYIYISGALGRTLYSNVTPKVYILLLLLLFVALAVSIWLHDDASPKNKTIEQQIWILCLRECLRFGLPEHADSLYIYAQRVANYIYI